MKQFVITPAAGKRLIAKAVAARDDVQAALMKGTLVIVAGTTNAYVAQEVLAGLGLAGEFCPKGFRRGAVFPPGFDASSVTAEFAGDVVLVDGAWQKGKTIFDIVADMKAGDIIVKGANTLDLVSKRAGVLIGDPQCGTAGASLPAVVGRRVKLLVPVGVEKRVVEEIDDLANLLNAPDAAGPRLLPLPGEVITELDAIEQLTGATPALVAAGGVCGAEGSAWVAVTGSGEQVAAAEQFIRSVGDEPPYQNIS